jgi:hypothetical protein
MRKGSPWRGGGDSSCPSAHRGGELWRCVFFRFNWLQS